LFPLVIIYYAIIKSYHEGHEDHEEEKIINFGLFVVSKKC